MENKQAKHELPDIKNMSADEKEIAVLFLAIQKDVKLFAKYLAIRKIEREINIFMPKPDMVTIHGLTRFILKYCPDAMKYLDEAVDKIYKKN